MSRRPTAFSPPARPGSRLLLALWLAAMLLGPTLASAAQATTAPAPPATPKKTSPYTPGVPASGKEYYALSWGVDNLSARLAESGQVVRFSYRVTDAVQAKALQDKTSTPYLIDEKTHTVLQVPTMEKVGPLRQSTAAEEGKSYWIVFSNKGNVVKPGHRVSVVIGQFRVNGLVVR